MPFRHALFGISSFNTNEQFERMAVQKAKQSHIVAIAISLWRAEIEAVRCRFLLSFEIFAASAGQTRVATACAVLSRFYWSAKSTPSPARLVAPSALRPLPVSRVLKLRRERICISFGEFMWSSMLLKSCFGDRR